MIRLDSTLRKLEIVLAGAVATTQPSFVASWSDASATGYLGGANPGSTNGTTTVTLVAAPGAGVVRDVDCIDVVNLDTATAVATIRYNDNGALYVLFKAALSVGDQLTYTHGQGWKVVDSSGALKSLSSDVVTLTGTQTLTNKTLTSPSVTDLLSSGLLTHSGDVLLSGSGKRITGDFSNATIPNRIMFQTSTTDGATSVAAMPNGSGVTSGFNALGASDPTNASYGTLVLQNNTEVRIASARFGTGTYLPMTTYVGGFKNTEQPITGGLFVTSPATMGYGPGAGGTVTQATSKSTAVTLNKPTGQITMNAATLAAGATAGFSMNNSIAGATSTAVFSVVYGSTTDPSAYNVWSVSTPTGPLVYIKNIGALPLSEAVILQFNIFKGATA